MKTIAYWTTTVLGPASFVIGGVLNFSQSEQVAATMHHLGYPLYFASILGVWKFLGAVAIVVPGLPRIKEWAYAGFFFDLTAAAVSRAAVGDSSADVVAPLVFLGLVLASWALRPASRKLAAEQQHSETEGIGKIAGTRSAGAGGQFGLSSGSPNAMMFDPAATATYCLLSNM